MELCGRVANLDSKICWKTNLIVMNVQNIEKLFVCCVLSMLVYLLLISTSKYEESELLLVVDGSLVITLCAETHILLPFDNG